MENSVQNFPMQVVDGVFLSVFGKAAVKELRAIFMWAERGGEFPLVSQGIAGCLYGGGES